jgi:hypothetical protein
MFSDTVTFYVHFGNDMLHLASDYERSSSPSAPPRSIRHYINRFCTERNIFNMQLVFQSESVQFDCEYELSLNNLPARTPLVSRGFNVRRNDHSYHTNVRFFVGRVGLTVVSTMRQAELSLLVAD